MICSDGTNQPCVSIQTLSDYGYNVRYSYIKGFLA